MAIPKCYDTHTVIYLLINSDFVLSISEGSVFPDFEFLKAVPRTDLSTYFHLFVQQTATQNPSVIKFIGTVIETTSFH